MKRILWVSLCTIALTLAMASPAAAQTRSPEQAVMLANTSVGTGYLPGNKAGSFAYYTIPYPGGRAPVTVRVSFLPGDPIYSTAFGFTVYGVNGFELGEGTPSSTPATWELVVQDPLAVTALILIHNYDWRSGATYRVTVSGLPDKTVKPTPVATSAPARATAAPTARVSGAGTSASPFVLASGATVQGSLVGDRGGAFHYATVAAAEGNVVRLALRITPDWPGADQSVGFTVYGPQGVVARGASSATPGLRAAEFVAGSAGNYAVQVFNYAHGQAISYQLTVQD